MERIEKDDSDRQSFSTQQIGEIERKKMSVWRCVGGQRHVPHNRTRQQFCIDSLVSLFLQTKIHLSVINRHSFQSYMLDDQRSLIIRMGTCHDSYASPRLKRNHEIPGNTWNLVKFTLKCWSSRNKLRKIICSQHVHDSL